MTLRTKIEKKGRSRGIKYVKDQFGQYYAVKDKRFKEYWFTTPEIELKPSRFAKLWKIDINISGPK